MKQESNTFSMAQMVKMESQQYLSKNDHEAVKEIAQLIPNSLQMIIYNDMSLQPFYVIRIRCYLVITLYYRSLTIRGAGYLPMALK